MSGPEWAVQAAGGEGVEQALAAEVVEVLPGLELLKTQKQQRLKYRHISQVIFESGGGACACLWTVEET